MAENARRHSLLSDARRSSIAPSEGGASAAAEEIATFNDFLHAAGVHFLDSSSGARPPRRASIGKSLGELVPGYGREAAEEEEEEELLVALNKQNKRAAPTTPPSRRASSGS